MAAHQPGSVSITLPINTDDPRKLDELGLAHERSPHLLRRASVRQELQLTRQQLEQLRPLMAEWEDAVGRMHYTYRGLRRARRVDAETRRRLQTFLTADQQRRLIQIDRQHRPPSALFWEDVGRDLGLTAAQRDQLRGILREYEQTVAKLASAVERGVEQSPEIAPGKWGQPKTWEFYIIPAEATPKMLQAGQDAYAKAIAVLTDAQRARWKELFGARFHIRELPFIRTMQLPGPS
jgi:predicted transcriptional regulator